MGKQRGDYILQHFQTYLDTALMGTIALLGSLTVWSIKRYIARNDQAHVRTSHALESIKQELHELDKKLTAIEARQ